jgi:hypothetical protein
VPPPINSDYCIEVFVSEIQQYPAAPTMMKVHATCVNEVTSCEAMKIGSNWDEPSFIPKLRRILDRTDAQEMKDCLVKYAETVELIHSRYPDMGPERADWAVAMALSPEWYGEELSNRLQNAMVVSALLLTVTASIFISPPLENHNTNSYRCLIYVTGLSNMLFIISIMVGIFFIENAMSRAYTKSERFVLIIKFYAYKDISQVFMAIGSSLFPIILAIPMWELYLQLDANILVAFTVCYVLATIYVMARTTAAAKAEQRRRLSMFLTLTDPATSRLLPSNYPPDAELQPEDFREMYQT